MQQRANAGSRPVLGAARRAQDRRHHGGHAPLHQRARAVGRRDLRAPSVHPDGATVTRARTSSGWASRPRSPSVWPMPCRRAPDAYGRAEVADAVGGPDAAIELVDDRYDDFAAIGGPTQIADNAFDAGSVLGAPVTRLARARPRRADRAHLPRRHACSPKACSDTLLGHPLDALAWLANRRSRLGWAWPPAASSPWARSRRCSGWKHRAPTGSRWRRWATWPSW